MLLRTGAVHVLDLGGSGLKIGLERTSFAFQQVPLLLQG